MKTPREFARAVHALVPKDWRPCVGHEFCRLITVGSRVSVPITYAIDFYDPHGTFHEFSVPQGASRSEIANAIRKKELDIQHGAVLNRTC